MISEPHLAQRKTRSALNKRGGEVFAGYPGGPVAFVWQTVLICLIIGFIGVGMVSGETEPAAQDTAMSLGRAHSLDNRTPIQIGDLLQYMVTEDRTPPMVLLVDEQGKVDLPLLGPVDAAEKTPVALAEEIKNRLEELYYYQATVEVSLYRDTSRRGQIFILGAVSRQGAMEIPAGEVLTVSRAIMRAGGFTQFSDPTKVTLVRPDPQNPESEDRREINVEEILTTGRLDKDPIVQANDLIFVAQKVDTSSQITLSGAVRSPGVYPMQPGSGLTLSQAILRAGGFTEFANQKGVRVVRHNEAGDREELVVDVRAVLDQGRRDVDIELKAEDMVIIPEAWIKF